MTAADRLDQIEARADAVTEGPWLLSMERPSTGVVARREPGDLGGGPSLVAQSWVLRPNHAANAEFIAASRQDVPDLVAALRAVLDVHSAENAGTGPQCAGCATPVTYKPWPCPTVRAIDAALGGAR